VPTELTSTSYAVLSLIGVRSSSAYELAQQMSRSLRWFWPKAESLVYAECKRLARGGFASTHEECQGRRSRTVYTITEAGHDALHSWLDRPATGPRLEWEAMLQIAFADHGDHTQLLNTLKAVRADAEERRVAALAQVDSYADGGPFPERLPVIGLVGKFFVEHAELVARWAAWAERSVTKWEDVRPDGARVPDGAFELGRWPKN
jgi:DNA-binding PadR family transcriptional regulator